MGHHDALLESASSGAIDITVPELSLLLGETTAISGSGKLLTNKNGEIILEIFTPKLPPNPTAKLVPGTLVPENATYSARGLTLEGFSLEADKLRDRGSTAHSEGFAKSTFTANEFSLVTGFPIEDVNASIEGCISPTPELFPNRKYSEKSDNPMFGGEQHGSWFELEVNGVRIGLLEKDAQHSRLSFWSKQKNLQPVRDVSEAFLYALSFQMGRQCRWVAYTQLGEGKEETRLCQPRRKTGFWYPPLPEARVCHFKGGRIT